MCDAQDASEKPSACVVERMSDHVTSYTRDVQNTSGFSKLLDVTTSAEGGGWGMTVSASVGFLTKSELTTSTRAYALGASGEVKTTSIKHPVALQLTDAAANLLARDPLGFLDRHSPNYIYSIVQGGSFLGIVSLNSRQATNTDQLSVGVGFSVTAGLFSAGVSEDFTREVEKKNKNVKMTCSANWLGGTGVSSPSQPTPASLAASYKRWSESWRQHPHELKVVLRKWVDIEQVQAIINNHSKDIQELFYADTIKPTTVTMLSQEDGLTQLVQSSVSRALDWVEVKSNRTLQDSFYALQLDVRQHILALERMDHTAALRVQGQIAAGNTSWFVALDLLRRFEDKRREIGRVCGDGSRLLDGICIPWAGTCLNGDLLPVASRAGENQCGTCHNGYIIVGHQCVKFTLREEQRVELVDHDQNTRVITNRVDGYLCALQEVGVEELALENNWSAAWCKIFPDAGRWRMHAEASGEWTDVVCGSRCIETTYPISQQYYVSRNMERTTGNSGISRQTMVPTNGAICWLSMASFWQASAANEWAECTVRRNDAQDTWELQASVEQKLSRTGSECGAVCLLDLPQESIFIGSEVIRQWEQPGCAETALGDADTQHCFLTSVAVSHAATNGQRPRCAVSVDVGADERHWTLRTCNGVAWGSKTLCGAQCVTFRSEPA
jgi:hypothetical protein